MCVRQPGTPLRSVGEPPRPVHEITRIAPAIAAGEQSIEGAVRDLFALEPSEALTTSSLSDLVDRHVHTLAQDVGVPTGAAVAASLTHWLDPTQQMRTVSDLLRVVIDGYAALAREWTGLLVAFVADARRRCRDLGVEQVVLLARDGIALHAVWTATDGAPCDPAVVLVDVNREMAGWSGSDGGPRRPGLRHHLERVLDLSAPTAVVDTGMYGTLVHALAGLGLDDVAVLFLTSKNPDLYGWLNSVVPPGPARRHLLDLASRCVDSIESWPKAYRDTTLQPDGEGFVTVASLTDPLSTAAHLAMVVELGRTARGAHAGMTVGGGVVEADNPLDGRRELARLDGLHRRGHRAGGLVPVVLSDDVPAWDGSDRFLREVWVPGPRLPLTTTPLHEIG